MSQVDCKVVVIGSASTGKTCLLQRYIHGGFNPHTQATIGGAFCSRTETLDKLSVVMGCWDTAGSERYASMSRNYYRGARAAIVCYDLTARETYDGARRWVAEILETEPDCKMYLCGNKKDLIDEDAGLRAVKKETARELALDLQADYFETSSKTGENIDQLFKKIARDYAIREEEEVVKNLRSNNDDVITSTSWKVDRRVKQSSRSSCCHS